MEQLGIQFITDADPSVLETDHDPNKYNYNTYSVTDVSQNLATDNVQTFVQSAYTFQNLSLVAGTQEVQIHYAPNLNPVEHLLCSGDLEITNDESQNRVTTNHDNVDISGNTGLNNSNVSNYNQIKKQNKKKGEKFTCDICGSRYSQKGILSLHMRLHTGQSLLQCSVCEKQFLQKVHLNAHMRTHTGERPYECKTCSKFFKTTDSLRKHELRHSGKKPFSCSYCGESFRQKIQMQVHIRRFHTNERPWTCEECGKSFLTRQHVFNHHKHVHNPPTVPCSICGRLFSDDRHMKRHMDTHLADHEREYSCNICLKRLANKKALTKHYKIHDDTLRFQCQYCGTAFRASSSLRSHVKRTHFNLLSSASSNQVQPVFKESDKKFNKCCFCNQFFSDKNLLKSHILLVHQTSENILCNNCNKTFQSKYHLSNHRKRCFKSPNKCEFECSVCFMVFEDVHIYAVHFLSHAPDNALIPCPWCSILLNDVDQFSNHQNTHHNSDSEKPFQCGNCMSKFNSRKRLDLHTLKGCTKKRNAAKKKKQLNNHKNTEEYKQSDDDVMIIELTNLDDVCINDLIDELKFRCSIDNNTRTCWCGSIFKDLHLYNVHLKCHSDIDPLQCSFCSHYSASWQDFYCHLSSHDK